MPRGGYTGLQVRVILGYRSLQGGTLGYRWIQGVTLCYRGYSRIPVPNSISGFMYSKSRTSGYRGLC